MAKPSDRRPESAIAEDVAEFERQLWEFAKQPNPSRVPEAKLRPGAFLYRMHRVWNSLGRGTGIASHSFRALKEELQRCDPPVRNLQPKLSGLASMSQIDASQLIDVMLATWKVRREAGGEWRAGPLPLPNPEMEQDGAIEDQIMLLRESLVQTLFKGEDALLLEEPLGVPPEIFFEERGRRSAALILPTKADVIAHLTPSQAYGGFSELIGRFFNAANNKAPLNQSAPLLIWALRLPPARDNPEFHQAFHAVVLHSAAISNWHMRLSRERGLNRNSAQDIWNIIMSHCAFMIHGLPILNKCEVQYDTSFIDEMQDLLDLGPDFFVPGSLPVKYNKLPQLRKHQEGQYGLTVSIEKADAASEKEGASVRYWLFPERPRSELDETAETTGLPVIEVEASPGKDYDLAYRAIYEAAAYRLRHVNERRGRRYFDALSSMGWSILTIDQLQGVLRISSKLS